MKTILLIITLSMFSLVSTSQNYQPVDQLSNIKIAIRNLGFNVTGTFKGLAGTIRFNTTDPGSSSFNVTIDANTLNTGNNSRDNHLRKEEYFDVAKYPKISFVSKQVRASGKVGGYVLTGNITIKGVAKEISFPFTVTAKNDGLLFTGECKLNRRDFNVGGSSLVLSDNVLVSLTVFAKK